MKGTNHEYTITGLINKKFEEEKINLKIVNAGIEGNQQKVIFLILKVGFLNQNLALSILFFILESMIT